MAGPLDVRIVGTEQLERLARNLRTTGAKDLRRTLLKRIRSAIKPLERDVRESARERLPRAGGLADLIAASKIGIRTKLSGTVSVRLSAASPHDIRSINAGRLRHPVYGTGAWVTQTVDDGWFDEPTKARATAVRRELVDVMGDVAREISRGV